MGCRHSLAEDIAQEAFLRLHQTIRSGSQIKDTRAWLFRVVRNLWIDNRRELRYWIADGNGYDRPEPAHATLAADPEGALIRREQIRLINKAMLRLPALDRRCMQLKAKGLRYQEIATTLDISVTAAVEGVRRGVRRVVKRLNE